jgi:hypothetical protein
MSGSEGNLNIMITQAEVHKCKSEYNQAWTIQKRYFRSLQIKKLIGMLSHF